MTPHVTVYLQVFSLASVALFSAMKCLACVSAFHMSLFIVSPLPTQGSMPGVYVWFCSILSHYLNLIAPYRRT